MKVPSMIEGSLFYGINHWKQLGWYHKLGEEESHGIPWAEGPVLSRLMVAESAGWEVGGLNKEQWLLPAPLSGSQLPL